MNNAEKKVKIANRSSNNRIVGLRLEFENEGKKKINQRNGKVINTITR
jgi:hypothetical protein